MNLFAISIGILGRLDVVDAMLAIRQRAIEVAKDDGLREHGTFPLLFLTRGILDRRRRAVQWKHAQCCCVFHASGLILRWREKFGYGG